jgi:ABC-type multidrug transport system fused ATPase/permease subunit
VLALAEPAQGRALLQAVQGLAVWPQGQLWVDGTPVDQWPAAALRRHAVWLDSAAPLWRGSLDYNLRYLASKAGPAALQAVLADVGLADWVAAQRKGLRQRVTEGGDNLPLAVRQRLTAARALLAEPQLLLIDETVVPMDDATRLALQRALAPHRARGMAVLWAQLPATRAAANDTLGNDEAALIPHHAARPH